MAHSEGFQNSLSSLLANVRGRLNQPNAKFANSTFLKLTFRLFFIQLVNQKKPASLWIPCRIICSFQQISIWNNAKTYNHQPRNSKLIIPSKPDRNQSKLTVCSVFIVTAHQDQLIQDKPTSWTSNSWQLAFAHPVDWKKHLFIHLLKRSQQIPIWNNAETYNYQLRISSCLK